MTELGLTRVDSIPPHRGGTDQVLAQFMQSGWQYARIVAPESRNLSALNIGLRNAILRDDLPVVARRRGNDIYLERILPSEPRKPHWLYGRKK